MASASGAVIEITSNSIEKKLRACWNEMENKPNTLRSFCLYSTCFASGLSIKKRNGKTQNVNGLHFEYVDSTGKRVMSDEERRNRLEATAVSVLCVEIGEEFEFKSNWRAVRCLTNGVVYQAVNMAAKALGLDSSSISKVCRGKLKATKGCVFEYVD